MLLSLFPVNLFSDNLLLLLSIVIITALYVSQAGYKFGVPSLLLFLAVGMAFGQDGVGIRFDNFDIAQFVGNMALTVILLAGGMETDYRSIKPVMRQGIILSTLGVILTVAFTGGFIWFLSVRMPQALPFGVLGCFLLAAAMSSTDSASVFNILRGSRLKLKDNIGSVLELESGSNDPVAYVLTITLVQIITAGNAPKTPVVLLTLLFQIIIGAGVGIGMGYLSRWAIKRIRLSGSSLYAIMVLCIGFLTNAVAADLKGNGLLALYIAAIIIGNDKKLPFKKDILKFMDGITWLAQILMFLLLGLLVNPSELPKVAVPAILIAVFMSLVARPMSVFMLMAPFRGMNWRGKSFISWVGLKGAAPILFSIYPVVADVPHAKDLFNIVFVITLLSLLFHGTTIPFAAKLLKVGKKAEPEIDTMGIEMPDEMGTLTNHIVTKKDLQNGNQLKDLQMPLGRRVIMIKRGEDFILPEGNAALMEGDQMLILESYVQNDS